MTTLRDLAHERTGDKVASPQIAVIAYRQGDYASLAASLTAERVVFHLLGQGGRVVATRHEQPALGAPLVVLDGALASGVTRSLSLHAHSKTLGTQLPDPVFWSKDRDRSPPAHSTQSDFHADRCAA